MADLDSRSKRASSVGMLTPWVLAPPLPDGTLAQGDRQHIAWSYSGILAAGAVVPPATPVLNPGVNLRRRWLLGIRRDVPPRPGGAI